MSYFGTICPIFTEGVEHELIFNMRTSNTVTTYPQISWTPGREVTLQEAKAIVNCSDGLTTSLSTTIHIFSNQSMSTKIGSIVITTLALSDNLGWVEVAGEILSTVLTSTDILTLSIGNTAGLGSKVYATKVVLRYRDT